MYKQIIRDFEDAFKTYVITTDFMAGIISEEEYKESLRKMGKSSPWDSRSLI